MNRKRLIALALALVMLFALAACGAKKPSVVGKWQASADMRDKMIQGMDESVQGSKSFGEYLGSFTWDLTLELKEDGNYTLNYDISRDLPGFKAAVVNYMRDMINEQVGFEVSDDLIATALGMPLEDYAQTVVDAMTSAAETETGKYQDKDGALIWGNGEKSPYELTENTLKFSAQELGELFFTRVG
ncbi:MAG: hypothetical protein IJQ43_09125 [Oscillospiraceae bacterium]|nr:hypothetical protein [Oscillospiraceae bacterium]